MECDCQDWKENIKKINGPILLQGIHGMGEYDGKQFVYCPWCGGRLQKLEDKSHNGLDG